MENENEIFEFWKGRVVRVFYYDDWRFGFVASITKEMRIGIEIHEEGVIYFDMSEIEIYR